MKVKNAYESYLKAGIPTGQDYTHYIMLSFLNRDYVQLLEMVKKGMNIAFGNHV